MQWLPRPGAWPADSIVLPLLLLLCCPACGGGGGGSSIPPLGVYWYAPFFSGGGYCSEATAFVLELSERVPVRLEQHGDGYSRKYASGLPAAVGQKLEELYYNEDVQPAAAVAICHSEPGAWHPSSWERTVCPPTGHAYSVGRTMFETDRCGVVVVQRSLPGAPPPLFLFFFFFFFLRRPAETAPALRLGPRGRLPEGWEARLNRMDEVWVPSAHSRDVFAAGGAWPGDRSWVAAPCDFNGGADPGPTRGPRRGGGGEAVRRAGACRRRVLLAGRRAGAAAIRAARHRPPGRAAGGVQVRVGVQVVRVDQHALSGTFSAVPPL